MVGRPQSTPALIDLPAAAEILGCHPKTVRRMIATGSLVGYRLPSRAGGAGKALRVDRRDVLTLVDELRIPTGGDAA